MTIKQRLEQLMHRMEPKKKEIVILKVVYADAPDVVVKEYVLEVEPRTR